MPVCETLDTVWRIELRPFRPQNGNGIALIAQFAPQLGNTFSLQGRVELDLVNVGRRHDQGADDENVEQAHHLSPLSTDESAGKCGSRRGGKLRRAVASVRSAARNLAERARGLLATASAAGVSGRLVRTWKIDAWCLTSGAWREPARVSPRSAR